MDVLPHLIPAFYLDAELVICRGVVEFLAGNDGEDVTVLQICQQLQMSGLLSSQREAEVGTGEGEDMSATI